VTTRLHIQSAMMVLSSLLLWSCPALAEGPVSDDFSAANLNTDLWSLVDPLSDSGLAISGGELFISVAGGTSHDVWKSGNDAPRVMQPAPNSDFEVEAKFSSVPAERYQLQGIIVEQDNGNFLRFDVYSDGGGLTLFAASFTNGSPSVRHSQSIALTSGLVFLRVSRVGDTWTLSFSDDGISWATATSFSHPLSVTNIGPFAGNAGSSSPSFTAVIDYFFNTASPISPEDGSLGGEDTSAPLLLNPSVTAISDTEVALSWRTDEPTDGRVDYGLTSNYELGSVADPSLMTSHSYVIDGLTPGNTYQFRLASTDAAGNTAESDNFSVMMTPLPVIDVWYGPNQTFGAIGQPQWAVNILGNVSDPDGISSLSYSLNGQPAQPLRIGPDNKRLQLPGDFNVEIDFSDLNVGSNTVLISATDGVGLTGEQTVTVNYDGSNIWPDAYSVDWSSAAKIESVAQVVDGKWALTADGVRPLELGYDRLIAIGDVTWDDYEVTVPVTVHGLDPACSVQWCAGGGPLVGVLMRWPGHSYWGSVPNHGWYPMGAFAAFNWRSSPVGLWMYRGSDGTVAVKDSSATLELGVPHTFKLRAETVSGLHRYSAKLWPQSEPEPIDWDVSIDEPLSATSEGSMLLAAHHADVTFGDVTVTPLVSTPDTTPPTISGVTASVSDTTATITWQTNEPASSSVSYGPTSAYENGTVTDSSLVTSHSVTLTGLTPESGYVYEVASVDGSGNASSSAEFSFTTASEPPVAGGLSTDDFEGALDTSIWTFSDPVGDSSVTTTGSQLAISVPAGTSHDLWRRANDAPRLMQSVTDGDFEVEVKFDSAVTEQFQIQGILVEQDGGNFIRFDFFNDGSSPRIFAATFTNGSPRSEINFGIADGAPVYMRVRREGDLWTQSYSYDGTNWLAGASFTHALTVTGVGVFAGNAGNSPPAFTSLVDYFTVTGSDTTPPAPDTTAPEITNVSSSVTDTTATVTWQTNEPASSSLSYGATGAYEEGTVTDPALVTSHSLTLSGLTPESTYVFEVGSTDGSGNSASSAGFSFTTAAEPPSAGGLITDEFDGGLDTNLWTFSDPKGDSAVSTTGSQLAISVPAGTSHDLWRNANHAPRLMQAVTDGNFEVVVKFDSAVTAKFQLQGIVAQQDDGNLVRFDFYHDGSSPRVFAASFSNGKPTAQTNFAISASNPMYMRVRREGDVWTQSYSYDGSNWLPGASFTRALNIVEVGVFAGNAGNSPPAHTALIDYFRVQP